MLSCQDNNITLFSNERRIRIKLICSWTTSKEICHLWSKMKPTKTLVDITYEDNNIDYYVIINKPYPNDKYILEKKEIKNILISYYYHDT